MSLLDSIKQSLGRTSSLSSQIKTSLGSNNRTIPSQLTPFALQNKDFKLSNPLEYFRSGVRQAKSSRKQEIVRSLFPDLTPRVIDDKPEEEEFKFEVGKFEKDQPLTNQEIVDFGLLRYDQKLIEKMTPEIRRLQSEETVKKDVKQIGTPIKFPFIKAGVIKPETSIDAIVKGLIELPEKIIKSVYYTPKSGITGKAPERKESLTPYDVTTYQEDMDEIAKAVVDGDASLADAFFVPVSAGADLLFVGSLLNSGVKKIALGETVTKAETVSARKALGLGDDYTESSLSKKYRELSHKNHPDLGGNDLAQAAINKANAILKADLAAKTGNNTLINKIRRMADELTKPVSFKPGVPTPTFTPEPKLIGEGKIDFKKMVAPDATTKAVVSPKPAPSTVRKPVPITPEKVSMPDLRPNDPLAQEARKFNNFQDILPTKSKPKSVKDIIDNGGTPIFHDTSSSGIKGILESEKIEISQSFGDAGLGDLTKRISFTRNFDNFSRYGKAPYRIVVNKNKLQQKGIPKNKAEFETIFLKDIPIKNIDAISIDITNPALLDDIKFGNLDDIIKLAKEKGIKIETFEGKILPDEFSNKEIQQLTKSQLTDIFNKAKQDPTKFDVKAAQAFELGATFEPTAKSKVAFRTQEAKAKIKRQNKETIKRTKEIFDKQVSDIKGKSKDDLESLKVREQNRISLIKEENKRASELKQLKQRILDREKINKINTAKDILNRRRSFIKAVQKQFNLSDNDLKTITRKDIRLMSNIEFKKFLDDIRVKSELLAEQQLAKNQLIQQIKTKELDVEPLRKSMKLPSIKNMTTQQLKEFDESLTPFDKGDVFLSQRKLETIERTELSGVQTYQQATKRLQKKLGLTDEQMSRVGKISEFDRLRSDTALAEKDPYFRMMVEETAKLKMIRDAEFLAIEEKTLKLAKKLDGMSLTGKAINFLIPQQKNIVKWFEAKDKSKVDLTKTESDLVKLMQEEWSKALDYLIKIEAANKGINAQNYFTHIRRGILEAVKEDGVVQAAKEIFNQYRLDEQAFNILDGETGEVLALDKFFRFSLKRTGELKPTDNVIRAFLTYMRTFKKKQALDEIVPLIDIYSHALTPKGVTKEGILLHGNLKKFTKEWLNTKKGRRVSLVAKQGGKIEWALKGAITFTTLLDIGLNLPVSIATQVGEQAITYQLLGKLKYLNAKRRALTSKGRRIRKKYTNFIGKNPWKEIIEPAREIGDRLSEGIFLLFQDANVRRNRNFLLGSMTKKEWATETLSPERLAHLRTEMGRYGMVSDSKSILGSTPEFGVAGQYKTWALPIMRTEVANAIELSKVLRGKKPSNRTLLETYRLIEAGAIILLMYSLFGVDEDDDSIIGQIKKRAYQELTTLYQAPGVMLTIPRLLSFLNDLNKNLTSIVKLERYQTDKFGEYEKGDLKGFKRLKKQLTPRAIKQFDTETQKTVQDAAIEVAEQIKNGEISVEAGQQIMQNEIDKIERKEKTKRFKLDSKEYYSDLASRIRLEQITVKEAKEEETEYLEKNEEKIKEDLNKLDEPTFIKKIKLLASAMRTDPATAFTVIFTKERIRKLENGTVIVERIPFEESQAIKKERGATGDLILDHTKPLGLGGTNANNNLKLVPKEEWERYTIIENYLIDKLQAGLISEREATKLIVDFKDGKIAEEDIVK